MIQTTEITLPIDVRLLLSTEKEMEGIAYKLDGKVPLSEPIEQIDNIDCSAFVRYVLYHATFKRTILPDGSWNQEQWCKESGLPRETYANTMLCDGAVRIAFLYGKIRHVWLVLDGLTLESYGGHGPGRRAWNHSHLIHAGACFRLTPQTKLRSNPAAELGTLA